jgi:hypothetical protein
VRLKGAVIVVAAARLFLPVPRGWRRVCAREPPSALLKLESFTVARSEFAVAVDGAVC